MLKVKLKYLDEWTEQRRRNAYCYNEKLAELDVVSPVEIDDVRAVYHLYVVRVPAKKRKALQDFLKQKGISTGIHYPIALPNLKAYSYLGHRPEDFPVASKTSEEIVSLPMYAELSDAQIEYVVNQIKAFF